MVKIILVDDHSLFRKSLISGFQCECSEIFVVGDVASGDELFRLLETNSTDLILLDINLPDIGGYEIAKRLRNDYPEIKIIAVSCENSPEIILSMIEAGINGFVSKQNCEPKELSNAIQSVMNGADYFGRDISAILFNIYVSKKKNTTVTDEFTNREREIIKLSCEGLMVKEIADHLGLSIHTVVSHKRKIFLKLGINNQMEMVKYALKKGIVGVES